MIEVPAALPANILAVDDTPANLNLLCGILKERGYRVRPVPSGPLALQAAAADPPDLVLLDIAMPKMDGFEVCTRLKADPRSADVPIIFLTGRAHVSDKLKAFALGGVDYVTKPFQADELQARVATHLELCRQRRELRESHDRLQELQALRDTLMHMIVHDLRSPLTAMNAMLQVLQMDRGSLSAISQESLEVCLTSAKRMLTMVSSVLDVSKLEAAAMTLELATCDLTQLTRGVVGELRGLASEHRVVIEPAARALPILADAALIERVVQNLLTNALRFTPRGGTIRIDLEDAAQHVRFVVQDCGPGVPEDIRERIFSKFGAAELYASRRRDSTGLGLPFCRLAVEAHGGTIGVESGPNGVGSRFWFTLPKSAS